MVEAEGGTVVEGATEAGEGAALVGATDHIIDSVHVPSLWRVTVEGVEGATKAGEGAALAGTTDHIIDSILRL